MTGAPLRVLFLCTGNSARSLLAEAVLNREGAGRCTGSSAGSFPTGRPHPLAIELLRRTGHDTSALRSKSWDEFSGPAAAPVDVVITVCDNAAGEVCPVWPGRPVTAHWGLPDPAAVEGDEATRRRAFETTLDELRRRIGALLDLPLAELDPAALRVALTAIGTSDRAVGRVT